MRMITFSILRHFKRKPMIYAMLRRHNSDVNQVKFNEPNALGILSDTNYIEVSPSWPAEELEKRMKAISTMRIFPNFVTEEEEAFLLAEVEPQLKKLRYEYDHWDNSPYSGELPCSDGVRIFPTLYYPVGVARGDRGKQIRRWAAASS